MVDRRLAWGLLLLTSTQLAVTSGCEVLHRYRPVALQIRDAETHRPIAGAQVHISYPLTRPSVAPHDSSGTTDDQGITRLEAAPVGDDTLRAEAAAKGYLTEDISLAAEDIRSIKPAPLFRADDRRPIAVLVELYAEPHFQVELVLPNGFRGLVRASVQIQDGKAAALGQRCYSYQVAPTGDVVVTGPAVLRRVFPRDYRARFADGTLLNAEPGPADLGLRPLKREGQEEYFVVGTQVDLEHLSPTDALGRTDNIGQGGGKGSGRGGGGRHSRGGQSSASGDTAGG
jgi:hypothetical protein